jgi:HSP20 family molecular chaperone IbpA
MTTLPFPPAFLEGFRDALERLSDTPLPPALDLYSTPETIVAKAALPGLKPENVDITINDDLVTISGSLSDREPGHAEYVHRELDHGAFSRSFWLPAAVNAEAATASLEDGLLTLTIPKHERPGSEANKTTHVRVEAA